MVLNSEQQERASQVHTDICVVEVSGISHGNIRVCLQNEGTCKIFFYMHAFMHKQI